MHLPRRATAGALALLAVLTVGCSEYDNGNNTLAERDPSPTPAAGDPRTTAPVGEQPSGPTGTGAAGAAIPLEAKDNVFEPKTIEAKAGAITIEMKNTGVLPHTFTNADLKVDVNADGGKSATINLTDVKAGTYKIICKYHEALGMVGELKVT